MSTEQHTLAPNSVDPNVRIPDNVAAAGASADELHRRLYTRTEPTPEAPAKDAAQQELDAANAKAAAEEAARAAALQASQDNGQHPQDPPQEQHPAPSAADANVSAEDWRHRFLSMQGRYNASVKDKASMQEQMNQLAAELVRTQNILAAGGQTQAPAARATVDHNNLITDSDREAYGDDLIDLARRAAREATAGDLDQLRQENQQLQQRVQKTGRRELFQSMDQQLPAWRAINVDDRFKAWLRLPNIYTGEIRGEILKSAVDGANAPKAIQIFKDFLAEARATGQQLRGEQQIEPQAPPAPREPAVALETLAAPGRARPASGDSQVPSEKPTYSRADIAKFYDEKRRGLWAHRLADADKLEADIMAAQSQGRIR